MERSKSMKRRNKDVPAEAIVKQLLIECGKLKSEIAYLEEEISRRDKAISEFKEWQKKVCDQKYKYWLNEGLKIAEREPPLAEVNALREILGNDATCMRYINRLEKVMKVMVRTGERLKKSQNTGEG